MKNKSLEEKVEPVARLIALFNKKRCILEILEHSVDSCNDYGTAICNNSKYRDKCSYYKSRHNYIKSKI